MVYLKVLLLFLVISWNAQAKDFELSSGADRVHLIELYSSEGCSSCPPADKWLARLRLDKGLWKKIVPVEFHVDYWNNLGWADPHSNKRFTKRQRAYAHQWKSKTVYTPGFVLNGKEWRTSKGLPTYKTAEVGELKIKQVNQSKYLLEFNSKKKFIKDLVGHLTLLGNGLVSKVPRGENAGRTLHHEFVVVRWKQTKLSKSGQTYQATIELELPKDKKAKFYSLAAWVQKDGDLAPLQAVGGDLK